MAFALAEAYVELSQRGFAGVMGGITSIGSKLTSLLSPITLVSGALGAIGAGAGIGGMIKLAAESEALETQFITLLSSGEKAKQMIADLKAFGAKTPFEFPGLAQTAKNLLAFGVEQEQILPTLQVLGDMAAATGQDINELGAIYGKVKANGKLSMETLMQLQERSIPITSQLAKQLGKADSEIQKMVSDGKIGFGDVQQALAAMTAEGGKFAGGMERQAGTLGGLWSTFKDEMTSLLTEIGTAIVEAFDLKGGVASLSEMISGFKGWFIPTIVGGLKTVIDYLASFAPYFIALGDLFSALGGVGYSAFQYIVMGMDWFFGVFQDFSTNLLAPIISGLADMVRNFDLYWQLAYTYVANFAVNAWESVKTSWINMYEIAVWAVNNWQDLLWDGVNAMLAILDNLGQNIRALWQGVIDFISGNGFNVDFKPLLDGFESTIKKMPELTKANLNQLQPEIDAIYADLDQRHEEANQKAEAAKRAAEEARLARETAGGAEQGKFAIDDATKGGTKKDKKDKDKFSFVGIAELASKMQTDSAKGDDAKKAAEASVKSAEELAKITGVVSNGALKVSMAAFAAAPPVNFAFGEAS